MKNVYRIEGTTDKGLILFYHIVALKIEDAISYARTSYNLEVTEARKAISGVIVPEV